MRISLGLGIVFGGLCILGDVTLAKTVSAAVIGYTAVGVGAFEIVHAFWTKGWGGLFWHLLFGAVYIVFGLIIIAQPGPGAFILSLFIALIFIASGSLRIFVGASRSLQISVSIREWTTSNWMMMLSGTIGIIAGLIVLMGRPMTGIWLLGLLLAIDLIIYGLAWLSYGWSNSRK